MNWSTPATLKAQAARAWERGDLLRAVIGAEGTRFPWRLALKTPGSSDLTAHFEAVRDWVANLSSLHQVRIEWREVRHRVQGSQRVPVAAWIDSLDDALDWLGKRGEAQAFSQLAALAHQSCPALLGWLAKDPLRALQHAAEWDRLLAVVSWVRRHPRPGVYLRQVDLPGVHTKFIEAHRGVLAELLNLALPPEAIDSTHVGVAQFAQRFGFRDKPVRVRLRVLDPALDVLPGTLCPDLTLDSTSFSRLRLPIRHVYITENETNFLVFPPSERAIVVFGAGYGWTALHAASWLKECVIHYWGDIDTHGFSILSQLRHGFPHVESILMDHATLEAHRDYWTTEPDPLRHPLDRLADAERQLYDALRRDDFGPRVRLEQELIGFDWLAQHLERMTRKHYA